MILHWQIQNFRARGRANSLVLGRKPITWQDLAGNYMKMKIGVRWRPWRPLWIRQYIMFSFNKYKIFVHAM